MKSCKISVIIPCYNAEKWIEECLTSAINQTYKNKEILVVDNESTDDSLAIVKSIQVKHPKIKVLSAPNKYPNCWDEARLLGFGEATGDYLVTLGADDVLSLEYLDNLHKFFVKTPEALAVQSPIIGINNGARLFMPIQGFFYETLEQFKNMALQLCPVTSPSVVFNRELWDMGLIETLPEKYSGAADYDLYCRLADKGIFIHCIPYSIGYRYRWHKDQATWEMFGTDYDKKIQAYWGNQWKS
jgi:glycosyltransferase involved in cell wall biosynthesis